MLYDRIASRYDRCIEPLERLGLARWRAEAAAELPPGSRVLEIGAGTGRNLPFYSAAAGEIALTELSLPMLETARTRAAASVHLIQADAVCLPFADDTFDAAIATLVFCSIPSPQKAFAELIRTVRSGGSVVLLEHVRPPGLLGLAFDAINVVTSRVFDDHFNRRTAELAHDAGLRIVALRPKLGGVVNLIVAEVAKGRR
ncbi:MAG: class I SAM-dependent methyltransferase [Pyrinomonadaceae bacterium]